MRWKILFLCLLMIACSVAGGIGWVKWNHLQKEKKLHDDVSLAMNQYEMGNHPRAQANFERILKNNPDLPRKSLVSILSRLAESYQSTEDRKKAAVIWERIRNEFPDSEHVDEALAWLADKAFSEGRVADAEKMWQQVLREYKGSDGVDDALYGLALITLDNEGQGAARLALLKILDAYPDSNRIKEVETLLGQINVDMLYSGNINEAVGDKIYKVKSGDLLQSIGRREKVSVELLKKINQIKDARRLNIGKRLKIPELDFSIVVDKTENTLLLLNRGEFFKRYPVRTGRENWRTPAGSFKITYKKKDPAWNKPGEGTIAPGDPENALGTRWMAFEGSSLGIHGTNKPETIGTYASEGCVGMIMKDVEELFEMVPVGTPVKIKGKLKNRG